MNVLKYIFNKKFREETKKSFSYQMTYKIDAYDKEIEMIYKEILRNQKMVA